MKWGIVLLSCCRVYSVNQINNYLEQASAKVPEFFSPSSGPFYKVTETVKHDLQLGTYGCHIMSATAFS